MTRAWLWTLCALALASAGMAQAAEPMAERGASRVSLPIDASRRVALVIGNGSYRSQALANPAADARAIGRALQEAHFETQVLVDADRMTTIRALETFRQRLRGAGVGLFYFAGHGVQMDGQNYLIPVDADMTSEDQVKYNTLRLDDVLGTLDQGGTPAKIVILDACRNNPFERGRGTGGGLAAVSTVAQGTLIAYATGPGRVALDGTEGGNGLYTTHLLRGMRTPGLPIEEVFKRTRASVAAASQGRQVPWESTSLTGDLTFLPGRATSPGTTVQVAQVADSSAARGVPRVPTVGEVFRDCERCPEMTVVPAGSFVMGAPADEPGRQISEGPQQRITVARPFAVGRFEVTFDEWEACLLDGGCDRWPQDQGWGRGRHPVVDVSWEDAQRYLAWLSRRSGRQYRLLSEAEWEYAARAGSTAARPWGATPGTQRAQCRDCGGEPDATREVGAFPANAWRLHDVMGNAWEWVEDCETPDLHDVPHDGSAQHAGDCAHRGVRGGGWSTAARGIRSATRSFYPVSRRDATIGFRVAATLP